MTHSPTTTLNHTKTRVGSIDFFRSIAIIMITILHTGFMINLPDFGWQFLGFTVNSLSRFAVPFFFLASGYFFHKSYEKTGNIGVTLKNSAIRIVILYALWGALYFIFHTVEDISVLASEGKIVDLSSVLAANALRHFKLENIFWLGFDIHFWFLPALIYTMVLTAIGAALKKEKLFWGIGILLFVIGVLGQSYNALINNVMFPTRDGIFFGFFFFITGYMLWGKKIETPRRFLIMAIAGFVVQFLENMVLVLQFGAFPGDFSFGTAFFAIGLFLFALGKPDLGRDGKMASLGRLTLGIYCLHFFIIQILFHFRPVVPPLLFELLCSPIAYFVTLWIVSWLDRFKVTRKLVA